MGLLSNLFGQQAPQAQTAMQPQGGLFSGRAATLNDPAVALPLAAALMQPGQFGQNLGQGFAMAGQGLEARKKLQKEELQQNMTAKYLEAQGADPALVEMAKSGAGAQALQAWQQTREKPLDELRLKTAQLQYDKLAKGDDGTPETFGLNPIYGQNDKNETVLGVVGNKGTFKPLNTPGFSPSAGIDKVDLGDRWGILDKRSGQITGYEPKNLIGAESDKAKGKAQGEAIASIPAARGTAAMVSQQIQDLKNDPYLPQMVGPFASRLPNTSANAARVQSKMDQVQGGAFLQARQMLKGGGAITDYEGQKAEAAYARMNTAQNINDYKQALDQFNEAVQQGIAKLEAAGGQQGGIPAPAQPSPQGNATSSGVTWRVVP